MPPLLYVAKTIAIHAWAVIVGMCSLNATYRSIRFAQDDKRLDAVILNEAKRIARRAAQCRPCFMSQNDCYSCVGRDCRNVFPEHCVQILPFGQDDRVSLRCHPERSEGSVRFAYRSHFADCAGKRRERFTPSRPRRSDPGWWGGSRRSSSRSCARAWRRTRTGG